MKTDIQKKLALWGIPALWLALLANPARAQVGVGISVQIELPPPIVWVEPPVVVVLPETYVYVAPNAPQNVDVYFYDGWWYRPYSGHWFRSHSYDAGWVYYSRDPIFYREVPQDWRNNYQQHQWGGHPWNYQPIPHQQVQKNWNTWKRNQYWERQQTWGVQGLQPSPGRHGGRPYHVQQPQQQRRQPQARPAQHQRQQPQARPPQGQGQQPHMQQPGGQNQHQGQQPGGKRKPKGK